VTANHLADGKSELIPIAVEGIDMRLGPGLEGSGVPKFSDASYLAGSQQGGC
jgi:hypothetical protein